MQQEKINKLFFNAYLIQNNIYEEFYKNLEDQNCIFSFKNCGNYIHYAFDWYITPEGYNFWEKEAIKYNSMITNMLLIKYFSDFIENLKWLVAKYEAARF